MKQCIDCFGLVRESAFKARSIKMNKYWARGRGREHEWQQRYQTSHSANSRIKMETLPCAKMFFYRSLATLFNSWSWTDFVGFRFSQRNLHAEGIRPLKQCENKQTFSENFQWIHSLRFYNQVDSCLLCYIVYIYGYLLDDKRSILFSSFSLFCYSQVTWKKAAMSCNQCWKRGSIDHCLHNLCVSYIQNTKQEL